MRLHRGHEVAATLAPAGTAVTLTLPDAHDGTDDYGRLLRYVGIGSADIGLQQIKKGAQAKYDSTDGYDKHPRQKKYRQQDIKHRDYCASHDLGSYQPVSANACPRRPRSRATAATTGSTTCPGPVLQADQPRGVLRHRGRRQEGRLPRRPGLTVPAQVRGARSAPPSQTKRQPTRHLRNDPGPAGPGVRVAEAGVARALPTQPRWKQRPRHGVACRPGGPARRAGTKRATGSRRQTKTKKCTRARPGREGGRALIVHASVGQRLDNGDRSKGGSMTTGSARLNESLAGGLRL